MSETDPWEYSAQITRVIDGDTVECHITKSKTIDFGFRFKQQVTGEFDMRLRLIGLDTPEISGVKHDSEEYAAGIEAKEFVITWLDKHCSKSADGHWQVLLKTHDGKRLDAHPGKYHGRWLAEVWTRAIGDEVPLSLNEALKAAGHDKLSQ
jgi:hypothetical protein